MGPIERQARRRGFDSPNKLAQGLLERGTWPDDYGNHRSLGNALRQVYEGERDWLDKDPRRLRELAAALGWQVGELQEALEVATTDRDTPGHLLSLPELFDARPVDLRTEELYPGLPPLALDPSRWTRHWWHTPMGLGHGQDHLARWLEVRGLAQVVRSASAADAARRLGGRQPTLVMLEATGDLQALEPPRLPAGIRVLVCCAGEAPKGRADTGATGRSWRQRIAGARRVDPGDWQVLSTPRGDLWQRPLVAWARRLLPADAALDPGELDILLTRKEVLAFGLVPGDTLALVGLLNYKGLAWFDAVKPAERVATWLELALNRLPPSGRREWLSDRSTPLILAMVKGALCRGAGAIGGGLDRTAWGALVPDASLPPEDLSHLAERLEAGEDLDPEDRRRLAESLRGRPEAVVDALCEAGLLRPGLNGGLDLSPLWVAQELETQALNELVAEGPATCGAAALHPEVAGKLFWLLVTKARRGAWASLAMSAMVASPLPLPPELAQGLLAAGQGAADDEERGRLFLGLAALLAVRAHQLPPEHVVAWDLLFRAIATATLLAGELPEDPRFQAAPEGPRLLAFLDKLVALVFLMAQASAVPQGRSVRPLLPLCAPGQARSLQSMLGDEGFELASFVLGPRLPVELRGALHPIFNPLAQDEVPEGLVELISRLERCIPEPDLRGMRGALRGLLRPVVARFGELGAQEAFLPDLLWPVVVARRLQAGEPLGELLGGHLVEEDLQGLLAECAAADLAPASAMAALWKVALEEPGVEQGLADLLGTASEDFARSLVEALPPEFLDHEAVARALRHRPMLCASLTEAQWRRWLASPDLERRSGMERLPLGHLPDEILVWWLSTHPPSWRQRELFTLWWERLPELARSTLHATEDPELRLELLRASPDPELPAVLGELDLGSVPRDQLGHWLHGLIARRRPGWREALALRRRLHPPAPATAT